ncbi:g10157 [Coccomyxa viridis]|uniref:G10157 protein n=1 Tax=Coccomyxa viridis TaxID=1274662 RepID=A0ABP1GBP8_9CHLO
MKCGLPLSRSSHEGVGLSRGLSAPQVVPCTRRVSHIVCGSKKKKAEKRVKDGRKRLADVIQELQTSTSFDRDNLQSRLQEIDTVLCGDCKESTSSSSSSEDECLEAEMGNTKSSESMPGEASNVVPMRSKLRADKVLKREAPISAAELVKGLPEGASVRVCQGKACQKKGSVGLMTALQESGASCADSMVACKCLDKCKLGPNVAVTVNGSKQVVQVAAPELLPV